MLAQALGLVTAKAGLPEKLLRRSPLDIRQLYTPSPAYFPVQRMGVAPHVRFKELRPATWGLSCVLGDETKWDKGKKLLADFVLTAMALDPEDRPHAVDLRLDTSIKWIIEKSCYVMLIQDLRLNFRYPFSGCHMSSSISRRAQVS